MIGAVMSDLLVLTRSAKLAPIDFKLDYNLRHITSEKWEMEHAAKRLLSPPQGGGGEELFNFRP